MFGIALYNTLRKIDGVTDEEAKEAVADITGSKEVATKADLERMGRVIIMWICGFIVGYSVVLLALVRLFM